MFRRTLPLLIPCALALTSTSASAIPVDPWEPPIPTSSPPLAPTTLQILKRDANRVDFRFRDRATNETGYTVQRRLITSNTWQTVASYPARNTGTYTTYFDSNVTGDAGYCYRAVATNADGSAYSSSRCAYTKAATPEPVWRAELRIETANVSHAGTDNSIRVRLNDSSSSTLPYGNEVWLNYSHNDFEQGTDFSYDLSLDSISSLEDITKLQLYKEGTDAICIREIELIVNEESVYFQGFGNTTNTCKWLDNDPGYSPYLTVSHAQLRGSAMWQSFAPGMPLVFENDELISRVESMIGNAAHGTALQWGELNGSDYVETTWIDPTTLHFDIDMEADLTWPLSPEVDIDFDLTVDAACYGSTVDVTIQTENFTVDADNSLIEDLVGAFVCTFAWDWNCIEEGIEDEVRAAFDEVAIETTMEDLGLCPNPGFLPQNGDLVFLGGS